MRIMLDTNILISIFVFNSKGLEKILEYICEEHTLVLSTYIIDELCEVISIKFPTKVASLDNFLSEITFETEYTPQKLPKHNLFIIRDKYDEKVLYSAITSEVDILITGDKDFADVKIEKPEILTPAQFCTDFIAT